jgi:DNA processing protein
MNNAARFAEVLAEQHFSICSGMAQGIDTCAHEAALAVHGVTVAVLGTGADVIYPKSNSTLAANIVETGALISELPLGSKAMASHFPKRNRIISGMSAGVIVVEAALKSGSLITARLAMEHNRELFAIPGSIRNPLSIGPHRLIQQGAMLVDSPDYVIEQLGSLLNGQMSLLRQIKVNAEDKGDTTIGLEDQDAKRVIRAMGYDPVLLEIIVERSELPLCRVQAQLLRLEFDGHVRHHLGRYVLC